MNITYNMTLKEQLNRNISNIKRIISNPEEIEYNTVYVDIDAFELTPKQLQRESSVSLIARQILLSTGGDKYLFPRDRDVEVIASLVDPDVVALVKESQICNVFEVTIPEIEEKREDGLLLCMVNRRKLVYDWNQARKLFSKGLKSISNSEKSPLSLIISRSDHKSRG